jgi:hypothetical protein
MDKEPINLFLDTTLTFEDPFFKRNYNSLLLRLSQIHGFPLFMSKVVYDETRNKFESNVSERIGGLEKALNELEIYHPSALDTVTINCAPDDFMTDFDKFYADLIERRILTIIEYDNSLLPILVERSIKRIKPFGLKKQEFRDAITWLSYTNYANTNDLINCYFITQNTSDFCDNKIKNTIHPELLLDSTKFSHFINAYDLLNLESKLKPYIDSADVTEWIASIENLDEYISDLFFATFKDRVKQLFTNYVDQESSYNIVKNGYLPSSVDFATESISIGSIDGDLIVTIVNDN